MKIRCPCCGAENSLDALIANDEARNALWSLVQIGGGMTKNLVMYLGLFRPEKSSLSGARMAKLLSELLPDIQSQRIQRDGKIFNAPVVAWAWALSEVVNARDAGTLKTPLKSHGYLYEVLSCWRGQADVIDCNNNKVAQSNKMLDSLSRLERLK